VCVDTHAHQVLAWDYFDVQARPTGEGRSSRPPLRSVPLTFASSDEYTSVFAPLLIEEAKAQVLRGEVCVLSPAASRAVRALLIAFISPSQ
jgi:hypothetical protein